MPFSFIHEVDPFQALEESWNERLSLSATNVPFLRHEFLSAWWHTRGGGEWEGGDLWVGVERDQDGALRAAAPFFGVEDEAGRYVLMFLGTVEIADYLDLVVSESHVNGFVDLLLDALEESASEWDALELYNIPEASPTLKALEGAAKARGWEVDRSQLQPCPVVQLESTWEDYLAGLDGKQRQEMRRKMRRAHRHPLGVDWRVIGPEDDILQATEQFMALMAHDADKQSFLTDRMREQFKLLTEHAHKNGWLHLSFLDVGGERGAGIMSFDYRNRIWIYNSGLDPAYHKLSLGWVILAHLFQWAIENGREAVDFLRGDETYKYRMGGVAQHVERLTIARD
jgi:CelD/BcsL family acetyltransferase involved in cellulose biosynthesis